MSPFEQREAIREAINMSVDIYVGKFDGNYTHNVSKLWHEHLICDDQTGFMALDGKTGAQAFRLMSEAFDRIYSTKCRLYHDGAIGEPEFCARYDAKNGWGSTVGGLIFMAQVMAACAAHPRSKVRVSV